MYQSYSILEWLEWVEGLPDEGCGKYSKQEWVDYVKEIERSVDKISKMPKRHNPAQKESPAQGEPAQGAKSKAPPSKWVPKGTVAWGKKKRRRACRESTSGFVIENDARAFREERTRAERDPFFLATRNAPPECGQRRKPFFKHRRASAADLQQSGHRMA